MAHTDLIGTGNESNTPGKGKEKTVLAAVKAVSPDSLPRSLLHLDKHESLSQARALLILLEELCLGAPYTGCVFEGWEGLGLVLKLIRDKVDIANDDYLFPLCGLSGDPALVERVEGGKV